VEDSGFLAQLHSRYRSDFRYPPVVIRHHFIELDKIINKKGIYMQIIALINQKGGVGKTTCAINIGAGLNGLGKRVLLIDLDPQAHFNLQLGHTCPQA